MGHLEIAEKKKKGPQDYMENNVLTRCVTYQVDRRDNKEEQELNSDCKVSNTWKESNVYPCWVDSGVESIKKEDAIGSDRVQKPCFDLERDIYPNLPPDEYDLVAPYRTGPRVRLGGTMVQELSSGPMVKMMFDSNYLLNVMHTNGRRSIPCLHQVPIVNQDRMSVLTLPVPGERYRLSNICTDAGLNQTERYHPILCVNEKTDNVVVITQSYKNDVETFRDYTKHLRKWLDGDMEGPSSGTGFT